MSSSSPALALLLAAALSPQQSNGTACPARWQSQPLSTVDVFDGPPAEKADLVPDISRGRPTADFASWNVSGIYTAGRHVFLACTYGVPDRTLIVEVQTSVSRCIYRSHPHKRLTCK